MEGDRKIKESKTDVRVTEEIQISPVTKMENVWKFKKFQADSVKITCTTTTVNIPTGEGRTVGGDTSIEAEEVPEQVLDHAIGQLGFTADKLSVPEE